MLFDKVLLAALSVGAAVAKPILRRDFVYGTTPVRGANIGGWLVLEPWITPSLFQPYNGSVVDEWTFCQNVPDAESILQSHWDSWTGLADFQTLASAGFNLVRIPIGYWAFAQFGDDPFIQGQADYMEAAIGWARTAGLKVWIDLHGAPLSQNGFDNSGERLATPGWTSTADSISAMEGVIQTVAQRWGSGSYSDVVVGIELINEPLMASLPGGRSALQSYHQDAFNIVRESGQTPVLISDGFVNPSSWNGFLTGQGTAGAIIDHHEYQVFDNGLVALSYEEHVSQVHSSAQSWATGQDKFVICGEWTAAMTDCAPALNGYGIGARYDGTYSKENADGSYSTSTYVGSCATKNFIDQWDDDMKTATTNYISAQIDVFESMVQGWIFWTLKTEASAEWDLLRLMGAGVWPALN